MFGGLWTQQNNTTGTKKRQCSVRWYGYYTVGMDTIMNTIRLEWTSHSWNGHYTEEKE